MRPKGDRFWYEEEEDPSLSDDRGWNGDPNVGSIYAGSMYPSSRSRNTSRRPLVNRFEATQMNNEEEIAPDQQALQFFPALEKKKTKETSWDDILEEKKDEQSRSFQNRRGTSVLEMAKAFSKRGRTPSSSPTTATATPSQWPLEEEPASSSGSPQNSSNESWTAQWTNDVVESPKRRPTLQDLVQRATVADPWSSEQSTMTPQSSAANYSKTSSAYMDAVDYPELTARQSPPEPNGRPHSATEAAKALLRRHRSAQKEVALPTKEETVAAPTVENLRAANHLQPLHRTFPSYLADKTKEVPSLLDADSDTTSTDFIRRDTSSDVFDNLSQSDVNESVERQARQSLSSSQYLRRYPQSIQEEAPAQPATTGQTDEFKLVLLGGGLTAIQPTAFDYDNRQTPSDYDDQLTNSDVDQYGYANVPGVKDMIMAGRCGDSSLMGIRGNLGQQVRTGDESGSSLFTDPYESVYDECLSEYYVPPEVMKLLLRRYRRLSEAVDPDLSLEELEVLEDESRAFALWEMRSRIMEKDMERGLERRGGTVPLDDIVTTDYHRTNLRIRDAVIVSKAWRDGASPKDVMNAARMTRRDTFSHMIPSRRHPGEWEQVAWMDDTDFLQYKCPSLGARHFHGFEMFTIGDCQSILLKMTNDTCMELRAELNNATRRQIKAEEEMKEDDEGDDSMMTDAEMRYLTSMEEVKTISRQLVNAEKAFSLVRERIERLVAKYQELLVKIETESLGAPSSVLTQSSYYTDTSECWEDQQAIWARRARRAELRAEMAAREALMAKQQVRIVQREKEEELQQLQLKLDELRSESSFHVGPSRDVSARLTKSFAMYRHDSEEEARVARSQANSISKQTIEGVKQRFRDRMASRKRDSVKPPSELARPTGSSDLFQSAGEEMYSHLDFYERSLKAVASTREGIA